MSWEGNEDNTVPCEIEEITLENSRGYEVDGVSATCSVCDATTESFGRGEASIKRCLAMLAEQCTESGDRRNFYVDENE